MPVQTRFQVLSGNEVYAKSWAEIIMIGIAHWAVKSVKFAFFALICILI